jgi:alkylation response protein AidB-like acyl-CoA dehydrogenase
MEILSDKQRWIRDEVRTLVREHVAPHAVEVDENEEFPLKSYEAFKEFGLLKLGLPEEFGGRQADATTLSLVIEEIAKVCASSSLLVFPTQAVILNIMAAGNAKQRHYFGSKFAAGDKLASFCLSEPNFGSDAGSLQTRAERKGVYYVINGTKSWITLGGVSDFYLVFVRTGPGARTKGISAIIVEKDTPGLSFGRKERKMGLRGSVTADVVFHNAEVPRDNLLLEEGMGRHLLTNISQSMRVWGAASMALGLAEGAMDLAVEYAKRRTQFGHIIGRQQAVQFMLADMKMKIEAVKSLIRRTTQLVDQSPTAGKKITTLISSSKCLASDLAMDVTEMAVQIHGAEGVRKGSPVERMMRDAKAIQIFDGSNQIQRLIIAGDLLG